MERAGSRRPSFVLTASVGVRWQERGLASAAYVMSLSRGFVWHREKRLGQNPELRLGHEGYFPDSVSLEGALGSSQAAVSVC